MLDHRHTLFDVKEDLFGGFDVVWVFSSATAIVTQPRPRRATVLPRANHTSIAFTDNSGRVQARDHVNEPLAIARESLEGLPCHQWVVFYYTPTMPYSHLRANSARVKGSMTLVKNSSDDLTNLTAVYVSIVRREDGRYGGAPHLSRNSKAILTSMGRKRPHSLFLEKT